MSAENLPGIAPLFFLQKMFDKKFTFSRNGLFEGFVKIEIEMAARKFA
jgi:hypothetical protein